MVLVALLLHLAVVVSLDPSSLWPKSSRRRPARPVQALAMTPALERSLEANRAAMNAATRKVAPPLATPQPRAPAVAGQIVDLPPSPDSPPPDRASYLSDHDRRVAQETRSRHQRKDYGTPAATPAGAGGRSERPNETAETRADRPAAKRAAVDSPEPTLTPPGAAAAEPDHLALRLDPGLIEVLNRRQSRGGPRPSDPQREPQPDPQASPESTTSADDGATAPLAGATGAIGAPSNDFLSGLEEGEGTFLNTHAFKYATFFNRIKRAVSEQWRPQSRGYPRSGPYWHTGVTVVLAPDGTIKRLVVDSPSGDDALDRAAVAAFQRSQPYPNPPRGLVDPQGEIAFRYGFYVFGGGARRRF